LGNNLGDNLTFAQKKTRNVETLAVVSERKRKEGRKDKLSAKAS
jgi:hypothetical protein